MKRTVIPYVFFAALPFLAACNDHSDSKAEDAWLAKTRNTPDHDQIEAGALKLAGKRATKTGEDLSLLLESGKRVVFHGDSSGCSDGPIKNCHGFRLVAA